MERLRKIIREMVEEVMVSEREVYAYHGSPHKFKKFTTSKMGTGEGVQAFGWGLYFTDLEDIAKQYTRAGEGAIFIDKTPLSKRARFQKLPEEDKVEVETILRDVAEGKLTKSELFGYAAHMKGVWLTAYNLIMDSKEVKFSRNSSLYKVTLHKGKSPDQYNWLEWDKPINEKNLIKIFEGAEKIGGIDFKDGWELSKYGLTNQRGYEVKGEEMYRWLSKKLNGDKQASLFLLDNGIDGIKYPAESLARGATSDTARGFNYVVFDENAVSIEKVDKI